MCSGLNIILQLTSFTYRKENLRVYFTCLYFFGFGQSFPMLYNTENTFFHWVWTAHRLKHVCLFVSHLYAAHMQVELLGPGGAAEECSFKLEGKLVEQLWVHSLSLSFVFLQQRKLLDVKASRTCSSLRSLRRNNPWLCVKSSGLS